MDPRSIITCLSESAVVPSRLPPASATTLPLQRSRLRSTAPAHLAPARARGLRGGFAEDRGGVRADGQARTSEQGGGVRQAERPLRANGAQAIEYCLVGGLHEGLQTTSRATRGRATCKSARPFTEIARILLKRNDLCKHFDTAFVAILGLYQTPYTAIVVAGFRHKAKTPKIVAGLAAKPPRGPVKAVKVVRMAGKCHQVSCVNERTWTNASSRPTSAGRFDHSLIRPAVAVSPDPFAGVTRLAKDCASKSAPPARGTEKFRTNRSQRRHPPRMPANMDFESMLAMTARTINRQPSMATVVSVIESRAVER